MTNLPITSSNPPPAKDRAELTPPSVAPLPAQTDDMPDAQPIEPFGILLAQQMDEAGTPALIALSSAIAIDTKTTADSANLTSEGNQNEMLAETGIPNDSASALIAMLQLPQEIRAPVIKDAMRGTTATTHLMTTNKAVSYQPAANIDPVQAQIKSDRVTVGNQVIHSISGPEISNFTVLANNLPNTPPLPAQDVIPPIAASGVMPNMPVNSSPGGQQTIAAPLDNHSWANEFSQKINWMSTQQNQIAELHLNPPDLGPLDVVLKVSGNQATALFTSPHGAVRDAVENALPKLRETLADNGITLGNATVSDQPPRDRGAEGFMRQRPAAARSDGSGEASGSGSLLAAAAPIAFARRHNGMVDTFA